MSLKYFAWLSFFYQSLHHNGIVLIVIWKAEYLTLGIVLLWQTYLQSLTIRLEEMRVKRRDSEQWMHHRLLPQDLRERVRRYDQYKWLETRGVDEQNLVETLPKDLRRDIKRHLCLALVRRVNFLSLFGIFVSFQRWGYLFADPLMKHCDNFIVKQPYQKFWNQISWHVIFCLH